jgi:phosphoribosyl 1,2-cyclic phosphodiesterase
MKVKIWGCRGSITTPGTETLRYGGYTTCLEIRSATGEVFVVDAGSGIRAFGKALLKDPAVSRIRFFLTHAHWDHLSGFPFFEPAYSERYTITFCSGAHAQDAIQRYLTRQMGAPHFPVAFNHLKAKFDFRCERPGGQENGSCQVGGVEFCAFPLSHPNGGYGFKFVEEGKSFIFLSDNELDIRHEGGWSFRQYRDFCRGADLLFHDAQYTPQEYRQTRGWGHSTYDQAVDLAMEAGVKRLGLFHHDPDRTDDDLDRQAEASRERIGRAGSPVECFVCAEGMVIEV